MATIYKAEGKRKAKFFLGVGHGGSDPGAVGYIREEDVNLNMAMAEKDYLVANGVEVCMSRTRDENDSLTEEIKECNNYGPDLAHDCHNNAGKGDGFESYYHYKGGKSKTLALNIEAEVKKIGQNSRGCKIKKNSRGSDYFGFIRQTNAPAIITEGVFVDNRADSAQADTLAEQREFGYAYARGVLKTLGIPDGGYKGTSSGGSTTKPSTPNKSPAGIDVKYRAWASGRWWSEIINFNNDNSKGYAGVKGKALRALQANTVGKESEVGKLKYRLHKKKGSWFGWHTDRERDAAGDLYSGNKRSTFDMLQMTLTGVPGYQVRYRVYAAGKWWGWITGYNNENSMGYAGVKGHNIEAVQIQIVKL